MSMTSSTAPTGPVATIIVAADGSGDYTSIQDGIDALPATGGVVYIKEGTYNITEAINLFTSNIALMGAGASTNITTTDNIVMIFVGQIAGPAITANNCIIDSIHLTGAGAAHANNYGIIMARGSNLRLSNCLVEACGAHGFSCNFLGGIKGVFYANTCKDNIGDGIALVDAPEVLLNANICNNNDGAGIRLYAADTESRDCNITGNTCKYNTGYGIQIDASCGENLVVANVVSNNTAGQILDNGDATVEANNQTA